MRNRYLLVSDFWLLAVDYSWEVEQDALDWETAIGGIATIERQLRSYEVVDRHAPLPEGLDPQPLHKFLARVEKLLLEHELF